jgi:hypothetical protein
MASHVTYGARRSRLQTAGDPLDAVELAGGNGHDAVVGLIVGHGQPKPVQAAEGECRREREPLVAIDRWWFRAIECSSAAAFEWIDG